MTRPSGSPRRLVRNTKREGLRRFRRTCAPPRHEPILRSPGDGVRILVSGFSRMPHLATRTCASCYWPRRGSTCRRRLRGHSRHPPRRSRRQQQPGSCRSAALLSPRCVRKQLLLDYCRSTHLRSSRYCCRSSCSTRWARPNAATRCAWRGCAVSVRARLAAVSSARVDARTSELEGAGREALRPRAARVRVRRLRPSNGC